MKDKKIKVFLLGSYKNNAGPDNVNRCLIENSTHDLLHIEQTGRVMKRIEIFCKIISSDIVAFSGFGKNKFWLFLCKLLRRKTIYLMHGCATYETKINKLYVKQKIISSIFYKKITIFLYIRKNTLKKIHFINNFYIYIFKKTADF